MENNKLQNFTRQCLVTKSLLKNGTINEEEYNKIIKRLAKENGLSDKSIFIEYNSIIEPTRGNISLGGKDGN